MKLIIIEHSLILSDSKVGSNLGRNKNKITSISISHYLASYTMAASNFGMHQGAKMVSTKGLHTLNREQSILLAFQRPLQLAWRQALLKVWLQIHHEGLYPNGVLQIWK